MGRSVQIGTSSGSKSSVPVKGGTQPKSGEIVTPTGKSNSEKAENFRRLAEKRTSVILDNIRKLGNLSNKYNYEWTHEELDAIFMEIATEMVKIRKKFEPDYKGFKF